MTAYLAGLAILRCAEHDRADEIDPTARLVLAVMASYAGSEDRPECYAAQSSVAKRAGVSRSTVKGALDRLQKLGIVEHGDRKGKTVRWELSLLSPAPGHKQDPSYGRLPATSDTWPGAGHKTGPGAGHKTGPGAGHNPSESSRPPGREDDSEAHPTGAATPRSDGQRDDQRPAAIVAEVIAARGGTTQDAQAWIKRKIDASPSPVRNEVAYLRACLAKEAATPAHSGPSGTVAGNQTDRVMLVHLLEYGGLDEDQVSPDLWAQWQAIPEHLAKPGAPLDDLLDHLIATPIAAAMLTRARHDGYRICTLCETKVTENLAKLCDPCARTRNRCAQCGRPHQHKPNVHDPICTRLECESAYNR